MKHYVSITDKFLSDWGPAKGKVNKLVIECKDYSEAMRVVAYAKTRSDWRNVSVAANKPYFNRAHYYVNYEDVSYLPERVQDGIQNM